MAGGREGHIKIYKKTFLKGGKIGIIVAMTLVGFMEPLQSKQFSL